MRNWTLERIKKALNPLYWHARYKEKRLQDIRHKVVAQYITTNKSILDIGGTKRANLGRHIPNEVITVNNRRITEPTIIADACELPIRSKKYDTVVAIQIFHQIPKAQRKEFIRELRRVTQRKIILHDYASGASHDALKSLMPNACYVDIGLPYMLVWEKVRDVEVGHIHSRENEINQTT